MPRSRTKYRDLIAVGASAGGTEALIELVGGFPVELPASVLVVQHTMPSSPAGLAHILSREGPLPATTAVNGEPIERGHIYVAPPDHHMLTGQDHLLVTRGPRENGHRPAVDPSFRSAARRYGQRVVAVVLSGALDDGTAGLAAVKAHGGIGIVQDPDDARHRGMPENAIEGDHPDYVVPIAALADLLCTLVQEPLVPRVVDVRSSNGFSELEQEDAQMEGPEELIGQGARAASVTCPECGGPLFEREEGNLPTFQCLVGHRFSSGTLATEQGRQLEAMLWTAVRGLYERAGLLRRLARRRSEDSPDLARRFEARARACEEQAHAVRAAIEILGSTGEEQAEATA